MEIKYCKNCINFTPMISYSKIKPEENYSWGYCRIITRLKINDYKIQLIKKDDNEVIVEKAVAVNQVIAVGDNKICPAFSNFSDMFSSENFSTNVSNIEILKNLYYLKCENCYHLFASDKEKIGSEEIYTCPICFHSDTYRFDEHIKLKPEFHDKDLQQF